MHSLEDIINQNFCYSVFGVLYIYKIVTACLVGFYFEKIDVPCKISSFNHDECSDSGGKRKDYSKPGFKCKYISYI